MEAQEIPSRILVIDDEPAVLRLVETMLQRSNYEVSTALSGSEALRLLHEAWFDCVITDAMMPVLNGYDLVRRVRKEPRYTELPILMLTRNRQIQDVKKAVAAGVTDYVVKPIDETLLLDKVALCLKKGELRRHVFECPINGKQGDAEVRMSAHVISMSESGLTVRLPMRITQEFPIDLHFPLFHEVGIALPMLRLIKCEPAEPLAGNPFLTYEAQFAFVGVAETDLRKIRSWIQKHDIQRRK